MRKALTRMCVPSVLESMKMTLLMEYCRKSGSVVLTQKIAAYGCMLTASALRETTSSALCAMFHSNNLLLPLSHILHT